MHGDNICTCNINSNIKWHVQEVTKKLKLGKYQNSVGNMSVKES